MSAARTIGRIRVWKYLAPPDDGLPPFSVDGCRLVVDTDDGADASVATARVLRDEDGLELGSVRVFLRGHGDAFYGAPSRTDDRYCYGATLEVAPEARGRGLAKHLMFEARRLCAASGGRGLTGLVDPANASSLRVHDAVGCRFVQDLRGVRLGSRVLWLSRRPVRR